MLTRYTHGLSSTNQGFVNAAGSVLPAGVACNRRDLVFEISALDGTGAVTLPTLPVNTVVLPFPYIYVRTAEATGGTKTLEVGVTGTATAFMTGVSVASAGLTEPTLGAVAGVTLGSYLYEFTATTTTGYSRIPYIIPTAIAIIWTPGSSDWVEFRGSIILPVIQVVDMNNMPVNADIANIDTGM